MYHTVILNNTVVTWMTIQPFATSKTEAQRKCKETQKQFRSCSGISITLAWGEVLITFTHKVLTSSLGTLCI